MRTPKVHPIDRNFSSDIGQTLLNYSAARMKLGLQKEKASTCASRAMRIL